MVDPSICPSFFFNVVFFSLRTDGRLSLVALLGLRKCVWVKPSANYVNSSSKYHLFTKGAEAQAGVFAFTTIYFVSGLFSLVTVL
jgi:hypothetical protein